MATKILVLNGPVLNMLGVRQPKIYGRETLAQVEADCRKQARRLGVGLDFRQSNHEGELVDWFLKARGKYSCLIVNAAAYTHTSVAILDALLAAEVPTIEVHISHILKREPFRQRSYVSEAAVGLISGFGTYGYQLAIEAAARMAARAS